ncbi:hypothetical protein [Streptomyces sp. NBC_00306]|nr:hypothetical protein [Streptomyces sp. NBC_00306]
MKVTYRTAFVTGAASGRATELARAGAQVALVDLYEDGLKEPRG